MQKTSLPYRRKNKYISLRLNDKVNPFHCGDARSFVATAAGKKWSKNKWPIDFSNFCPSNEGVIIYRNSEYRYL